MITLLIRRMRERSGRPGVTIRKYGSDKAAERGIEHMTGLGYEVRNHTTRKAAYGWLTGVFTRKQIHTITYVR